MVARPRRRPIYQLVLLLQKLRAECSSQCRTCSSCPAEDHEDLTAACLTAMKQAGEALHQIAVCFSTPLEKGEQVLHLWHAHEGRPLPRIKQDFNQKAGAQMKTNWFTCVVCEGRGGESYTLRPHKWLVCRVSRLKGLLLRPLPITKDRRHFTAPYLHSHTLNLCQIRTLHPWSSGWGCAPSHALHCGLEGLSHMSRLPLYKRQRSRRGNPQQELYSQMWITRDKNKKRPLPSLPSKETKFLTWCGEMRPFPTSGSVLSFEFLSVPWREPLLLWTLSATVQSAKPEKRCWETQGDEMWWVQTKREGETPPTPPSPSLHLLPPPL